MKIRYMRQQLMCFLFACLLMLSSGGIYLANAEKIENLKNEAEKIEQQIKENKSKIRLFTQKEAEVVNRLHETEKSLNTAKIKVSAIQKDLTALEKEITAATEAIEALKKEIQENEEYASGRMVALYKLNCSGKINFLASADSVNDFLQRKMILERILAHDENLLKQLAENQKDLSSLLERLNEQKKEKLDLESAYKTQADIMSREKSKRARLLSEIRQKKTLTLASVASLQQSAKALDKKIKTLIARKTSVTQKKPFTSLKGLLNMPVKGNIISSFGTRTDSEFNVKTFQSGIDIEAKEGEPVRAAREGEVVYASWFKGYGNMIIIDHGGHYHTVYAHTDKLFKAEGDSVKSGEVIATVGDTASMKGPVLHFEVRHHGKPVDPLKWLSKK